MTTLKKSTVNTGARLLTALLLAFVGLGACYGGGALLLDPSGGLLQMPLELLEHAHFQNYFFPGMILFLAIGVFSMLSLVLTIKNSPNYPDFVFTEGMMLIGWLVVQIYLIRMFHIMQMVMGVSGMILVLLGFYLKKWR